MNEGGHPIRTESEPSRRGPGGPFRSVLTAVAVSLIVAGAAACATAGGGQETEAGAEPRDRGAEVIEVENDLLPGRSVTVLAAPAGRPQKVLGSVRSDETRSFTLETNLIPFSYRLVAERGGAPSIVSREIQIVRDGATIRWRLNQNLITIEMPDGG